MNTKQELNREIGTRIKAAREAAGLTQEKFAELVQLGAKNISAIERGVVGVSVASVIRMCQVLHVSSDTLLLGASGDAGQADGLAARLERLSPEQFAIARDILNSLLEAFALSRSPGGTPPES